MSKISVKKDIISIQLFYSTSINWILKIVLTLRVREKKYLTVSEKILKNFKKFCFFGEIKLYSIFICIS